jgi:hypothetical protein
MTNFSGLGLHGPLLSFIPEVKFNINTMYITICVYDKRSVSQEYVQNVLAR